MTEDELVGGHHRLYGHEFKQTLGDSGGQGSLTCCSPWGRKELDMTYGLNNSNKGKTKLEGSRDNCILTAALNNYRCY